MRIARQPTRETRQASKSQRAAIVNAAQPSRRTPQPRWRAKMTGSRVIPCLRYRDPKRMIGWLCDAFGFRGPGRLRRRERWHRARPTDARRRNDYAGFAARRSVRPSAIHSGRAWRDHAESVPGGRRRRFDLSQRRCCWAEIVIEIKDEDYGGRGFCCRDPEGHLWNVGTYDPWKK